jgi:hypothetical protein
MSETVFLEAVMDSLKNMQRSFVDLSRITFRDLPDDVLKLLKAEKVQERPFAYEFYHHFRKFWDEGRVDELGLGEVVIQAEVNKSYQNIRGLKKAPDFLIHQPNTLEGQHQIAVMEFKLAENARELEYDFDKLALFKQTLWYKVAVEVLIGNPAALEKAMRVVKGLERANGELIHIVCFDTENWRAESTDVRY